MSALYYAPQINGAKGGNAMNPLDTLTGTVITGVVLAVVLAFVAKTLGA
jgi:hypothetical protein